MQMDADPRAPGRVDFADSSVANGRSRQTLVTLFTLGAPPFSVLQLDVAMTAESQEARSVTKKTHLESVTTNECDGNPRDCHTIAFTTKEILSVFTMWSIGSSAIHSVIKHLSFGTSWKGCPSGTLTLNAVGRSDLSPISKRYFPTNIG